MQRLLLAGLVAFLLAVLPAVAAADTDFEVTVNVDMDGDQEVEPVVTDMTGNARIKVEPHRLRYKLDAFGNTSTILAAHIHCAPAGSNGPVGVTLFSGAFTKANGTFASGNSSAPDEGNGCDWADLADVAEAVLTGNAYVNVHTTNFPAGEIRGDLSPIDFEVTVNVDMGGDQEVEPVVTDMTGNARIKVEPHRLRYKLDAFGNTSTILAAHIHCAAAGSNGPVGVTLFTGSFTKANGTFASGNSSAPDEGNGCGWADLADVAEAIKTGKAYVNVHTTNFPLGEVRGDLPLGSLPPIPAGIDRFESIGDLTLMIAENNPLNIPPGEIEIAVSSAGLDDGVVVREEQVGDTIVTEMQSLQLAGELPTGQAVRVSAGSGLGLPPSLGAIIEVEQNDDGSFRQGDSFFDINFVIEIDDLPPLSNCVDLELGLCEQSVRMELVPIKSLPPKGGQYQSQGGPLSVPIYAPGGIIVGTVVHSRHVPNPGCCQLGATCVSPVSAGDCSQLGGTFNLGHRCDALTGTCIDC